MNTLTTTCVTLGYCGKYATATELAEELAELAGEKGALPWKAAGMLAKGWLFVQTGKPESAINLLTAGVTPIRRR